MSNAVTDGNGEELTNLLNDNVPRIVGTCAAHDGREDGVSRVHRARRLAEASNHGVICSCYLKGHYNYNIVCNNLYATF